MSQVSSDKLESIVNRLTYNLSNKFDHDRFFKYFNEQDDDFMFDLCSGVKLLPPPYFFDHLVNLTSNEKIKKELLEARSISEKFFHNLCMIGVSNRYDFKEFAAQFEKKVQPIGKELIKHLNLINSLIKEQRSKNYIKYLFKIKIYVLNKYIENEMRLKFVYNLTFALLITIAMTTTYFLNGGSNNAIFAAISASLFGAAGLGLIINKRDKNSFDNSDIEGHNNLALKYKKILTQEISHIAQKRKLKNKKTPKNNKYNSLHHHYYYHNNIKNIAQSY